MDILGARVVAHRLVIAGQAQDIANAQRMGAEQIGLDGQPVAVAAGHLDDRLDAFLEQDGAGGDAAHADDGGLVVGDIGGIHAALQKAGFPADDLCIMALRRPHFSGDGEMSGGKDTLEPAAGPLAEGRRVGRFRQVDFGIVHVHGSILTPLRYQAGANRRERCGGGRRRGWSTSPSAARPPSIVL